MKIVTVGAGPSGLYASALLEESGHDVTVLEEHHTVGQPVQCAGLVGRKLVRMMGDEAVLNHIDGAHIHYEDSHFALHRKNVAYVLDRAAFDTSLSRNLNIIYDTRVLRVSKDGTGYNLETSNGTHKAEYLIGADGPTSIVRSMLPFRSDIKLYPAYQERLEFSPPDEHMAIVEVKRPFFSWIIPEGNGICRVGTIGNREALGGLKRRFGIDGAALSQLKAPIPIGRTDLVNDHAFLIGDAAAQTKPLTGGGLYYGLRAARMLADAIEREEPDMYQSLWDKKYGKEIGLGLKARRVYEAMSEKDLKRTFDIISEKKEVLERDADYERHSTAIKLLLSSPRLIPILGKNIGNLF
ncbi:MAG: NAD(P)/FAD-dependent oxidoreductase [Candidatus Methanofastidiosa archaeon]|nr:NAD(P)/FAD-dependent oxidoreductase [Candidatus Methanofastidiosa archaeon]